MATKSQHYDCDGCAGMVRVHVIIVFALAKVVGHIFDETSAANSWQLTVFRFFCTPFILVYHNNLARYLNLTSIRSCI